VRTLRKLVLGETWALPIGIAAAVGVAALVRVVAGSEAWWTDGGGFVLLVLLVGAFAAGLRNAR
jgi:hypothetical protein